MSVWISGVAMQLGYYLKFIHLVLEQILKDFMSTSTEDYSSLKAPFSTDISADLFLSTWQRHLWC